MNSLQELNNFGSESFDYIDARPSGVIFDRQYPLTAVDQELFISLTSQMPEPGINIAEIINYQTANVRYRVTIFPGVANPLTGSTIAWDSLPSGVSLTQVGNQYTINGIHSVAEWESVKYFTWSLPTNYASFPLWYLTVEIIYYDSKLAQDVVMDWLVYDDRFFYVAQLNSSANINAVVGVNSLASANLSASANITAVMFNFVRFAANLTSNATLSASGNVNVTEIFGRATMNAVVGVRSPATVSLNSYANISTNLLTVATKLIDRNYLTNNFNQLFATDTPILDTSNINDSVEITLTSSIGRFGINLTSTPVSSYVLSGTKNQINSILPTLYFFPDKDTNTIGSITWAHKINGILIFTKTFNINPIVSQWSGEIIQFLNVGNTTFTPGFVQSYYGGKVDVYLIAGGGAGASGTGGGGGGAGEAREIFGISITQGTNYTITVGAGGLGANDILFFNPGSPSSAFGYTARPGRAGQPYSSQTGLGPYTGGIGGLNGAGTFGGGTGSTSSVLDVNGGGGAGNAGNGGNASRNSPGNGGAGIQPTIWNSNGQFLGRGGRGGSGQASIQPPPIINNSGDGGGGSGFPVSLMNGASGRVAIKIRR
jgi:hypothetical protein